MIIVDCTFRFQQPARPRIMLWQLHIADVQQLSDHTAASVLENQVKSVNFVSPEIFKEETL